MGLVWGDSAQDFLAGSFWTAVMSSALWEPQENKFKKLHWQLILSTELNQPNKKTLPNLVFPLLLVS